MEREQRYNNQRAWDSALAKLVERLQDMGERIPLSESDKIGDRLFHVARNIAKDYGIETRERTLVKTDIFKYTLEELPEGQLFRTSLIANRASNRYNTSDTFGVLMRLKKKERIARVDLDVVYWIKPPKMEKEITILLRPLNLEVSNTKRLWEFIIKSIDQLGYCESPAILNYHLSGNSRGNDVFRIVRYHRFYRSKIPYTKHPLESAFDIWIKSGQKVFDTFVQQSGLPTASLYGITAIVYHPKKLIEAQRRER